MCIGSDFNNIISSVVFAPKNVSIFSLKITWADLIKGTYIFSLFVVSSLQTTTINMSPKQTHKQQGISLNGWRTDFSRLQCN